VADFLPADADVGQAFEKVSAPVENLLELHHVLWRRPFPDGFEVGRTCFRQSWSVLCAVCLSCLKKPWP
jgi:hypothetical protein